VPPGCLPAAAARLSAGVPHGLMRAALSVDAACLRVERRGRLRIYCQLHPPRRGRMGSAGGNPGPLSSSRLYAGRHAAWCRDTRPVTHGPALQPFLASGASTSRVCCRRKLHLPRRAQHCSSGAWDSVSMRARTAPLRWMTAPLPDL